MVYSRIHGYKIRMKNENSNLFYKKILKQFGGENEVYTDICISMYQHV
jgi:hypothetical protein